MMSNDARGIKPQVFSKHCGKSWQISIRVRHCLPEGRAERAPEHAREYTRQQTDRILVLGVADGLKLREIENTRCSGIHARRFGTGRPSKSAQPRPRAPERLSYSRAAAIRLPVSYLCAC
jgi:hypothetical protein